MARHGQASTERETPKKKITGEGLKRLYRLFRFIRPQKSVFILGLIFLLLSSVTTLIFPMLMGDLLDSATNGTLEKINRIGFILLGIFVANSIFSYFRIYTFAVVTQKTLALLRQTTYNHLIRLPMVFFSSRRVGELNSRISADIALLQETFTNTLAQFIRQVITIVGGITLLTIISYKLTLFMLAIVPVVAIIARIFGTFIRKLSKISQDKVAESNTIVEETLQAITNVKAFANEAFEILRYKKKTDEVIEIGLKGAKWRGLFVSFIFLAMFGSIAGVVWYGVYLVNQGDSMTSGDLFKFILYTVFIAGSISGMADLYSQIQKAIGATENLMDILEEDTEPFEQTIEALKQPECCKGKVEFAGVSFNYPTRKDVRVLKNISFTLKKGEQVALVGPSGAGKSTITSLLFRFYDPTDGQIFIDNRNIKEYNLTDLRSNMAIVPQEVLLFGGTIRENIEYGKPGASEQEIIEAARKANAMEFITNFPEGLDTIVGERGVQLSGGQRQRIAIARAILKDPAILILDEATSSLDSESERLVQDALQQLMKGRTSIVIAHRLSTIHNADKIIVIDKGEVKEMGSHEKLLEIENGIYKNLSELQLELMG
ncbi:MAG: ATP-binding cassette domain-containing protein [Bacteroidales bacterium]|nr:ATP-binding cassette domain-containing protein [Bacteroidales bacterium]